jgi:hypothetical protein
VEQPLVKLESASLGQDIQQATKSNKSKRNKSKKQHLPRCVGDDFMRCGKRKDYFVCLFDQANHEYKTVCSNSEIIETHRSNDADYCGKCPDTTTGSTTPAIPLLAIKVSNLDLLHPDVGGLVNTAYQFDLDAIHIPVDTEEVRFEWAPGYGPGGLVFAQVTGVLIFSILIALFCFSSHLLLHLTCAAGKAQHSLNISYPVPGTFRIAASVYNGISKLASALVDVYIQGTTLKIFEPKIVTVGEENAYTFTADGVPPSIQNVKFKWTFGVGPQGAGQSVALPTVDEKASTTTSFTYQSEGMFIGCQALLTEFWWI